MGQPFALEHVAAAADAFAANMLILDYLQRFTWAPRRTSANSSTTLLPFFAGFEMVGPPFFARPRLLVRRTRTDRPIAG